MRNKTGINTRSRTGTQNINENKTKQKYYGAKDVDKQ